VSDDERLAALSLVREGGPYDLGHLLDKNVPVFPGRYFRQTLVTTAHHASSGKGGVGDNDVNWVTEQVTGTMQLDSHLDALSHLQIDDRRYNGWAVADLAGGSGVKRLGAETVPQIVARGLLMDVPAGRGTERLGPGDRERRLPPRRLRGSDGNRVRADQRRERRSDRGNGLTAEALACPPSSESGLRPPLLLRAASSRRRDPLRQLLLRPKRRSEQRPGGRVRECRNRRKRNWDEAPGRGLLVAQGAALHCNRSGFCFSSKSSGPLVMAMRR